ncbi:WbqC family protein [Dyella silvae]|uniref:WbqC family protein n=1 Tax=Dyella silvae TaxID=2994424 RepID=UPI0022643C9C|nr:WbqC family protein [Dyella silvae]
MRVAAIQSSYIPWKGYFDIIHDVDAFIFYDDLQYTKRDWRSRNSIKTPSGLQWLTIPVGGSTDRLICDVAIEDSSWQQNHWTRLKHSYGRAPYFSYYAPLLEEVYLAQRWSNLSVLNQQVTMRIARECLNITTRFLDSREFEAQGRKLDRLVDLVVKAGASHYISGPSARSYIDMAPFDAAGITVEFKDYGNYPEYEQLHPPFSHQVSVLDLLFHVGPNAPWYIWGWRGS